MLFYMSGSHAESAFLIGLMVLSNDSNSHPQFASRAPGRFDFEGSVVGPQGLERMVCYMSRRLTESVFLIGSMVLSNDPISHRQFASIAPGRFDFEGSVVGPQGLERMVCYMSRRRTESVFLIGSMVLSNDPISHRQFASIAPGRFDFEGSVVGPQGLVRMVFYMAKRLAEGALLIGSTVLSNDSNSHPQFASRAPGRFDFEGGIVGPPALAKMVFYMSRKLAESTLLIGSTVLSIDSNSDRRAAVQPCGRTLLAEEDYRDVQPCGRTLQAEEDYRDVLPWGCTLISEESYRDVQPCGRTLVSEESCRDVQPCGRTVLSEEGYRDVQPCERTLISEEGYRDVLPCGRTLVSQEGYRDVLPCGRTLVSEECHRDLLSCGRTLVSEESYRDVLPCGRALVSEEGYRDVLPCGRTLISEVRCREVQLYGRKLIYLRRVTETCSRAGVRGYLAVESRGRYKTCRYAGVRWYSDKRSSYRDVQPGGSTLVFRAGLQRRAAVREYVGILTNAEATEACSRAGVRGYLGVDIETSSRAEGCSRAGVRGYLGVDIETCSRAGVRWYLRCAAETCSRTGVRRYLRRATGTCSRAGVH
jgi:hypothetical protein